MTGRNFQVPARTWRNIEDIADNVRTRFNLMDRADFPIMEFLEEVLDHHFGVLEFQIGSHAEMGAAEGLSTSDGKLIMLREDVYHAGLRHDGRARFTAAHELGHCVLHANLPMLRATNSHALKPYILSEPQADQFAGCLLMPRRFIDENDTVHTVAERFRVSLPAAEIRLRKVRK